MEKKSAKPTFNAQAVLDSNGRRERSPHRVSIAQCWRDSPLKTYEVIARYKTPKSEGMPKFGVTSADSVYALTKQLRNFAPQQATCPVCRLTARYSFVDYLAAERDE